MTPSLLWFSFTAFRLLPNKEGGGGTVADQRCTAFRLLPNTELKASKTKPALMVDSIPNPLPPATKYMGLQHQSWTEGGLEPVQNKPALAQQPNVYLEPKWLRY